MAIALLATIATGCAGPAPQDAAAPRDWPAVGRPLDPSGPVWAGGAVVHLDAGRTIDVGDRIESYVVGGGGVFFTRTRDETAAGGGRPLFYADADLVRAADPLSEGVESLRVSPDGRYLVLLDLASGEPDDFGTAQVQTVVVDLTSGREVTRTAEGMGDPAADDLAQLYGESDLGVLEVTDDAAYVRAVDGVVAVELATGETGRPGRAEVPSADDRRSPDGVWRIVDDYPGRHDSFARASGGSVDADAGPARPLVDLLAWLDPRTAIGTASGGRVRDAQPVGDTTGVLVTCVVPSGRCAPVAGTEGRTVVLPEGVAASPRLALADD